MELQTGAGSLRRDGGVTSRVTRRGKAPLCAAGLILCFQVLSIQAISFQFTKEPKSQDALHGRSAMLRCEVSDPANITYIWFKDDSRLKNTERRFQEGSNLKFISVDRQLDAGNFSCRASNSATGELLLSTTASFNIKWLESGGVTLKEPVSDGEIESSTTVTLRCHIDGHPRPTCQWFKDGVKLTESSHQINNKERTLTIQSASLDDSGLYYCCANNAAGHVCSNHNFTLTIIEKLKFTPTPQPSQCLELDKEITIQCSAKGREVPTIRWTKADGGELPPHLDQRNGQLRFAKVTRSDAGNYTCIASNSLQGEIRALVTLTVAVYVRFKVEPENTTVYQGHTAVLHCQASGDPEPHIHWMVKDKPLDITKNGRIQKMPDGSLLIREVTTEDTGRYTCVAGNSCSIEDRVAQLYVVAAPVWVSKPQDSSLEEGKPGYLHCYAQANPEPEVTWFRSSLIIAPEDTRFKLFPNGTLRINNVEVYDAHMYGCTTTNLAGSLSGLAKVTVLEKLKFTPTPQPSQCLELDKEITIQCSAKGREVPTIRWTKADGGELPLHLDQRNGQLRFAKVNRSDAGNYTCIASNSLQGEIRAMVTLTVAESRRR